MRPAHGVRSPAPRLVLRRPGSGSSGVFAGRPGSWKTRSAAGFFSSGHRAPHTNTCDGCGSNVWGKLGLSIRSDDCDELFEAATG